MTAQGRGIILGVAVAFVVTVPTWWIIAGDSETSVLVAANTVPEGSELTLSSLARRDVPSRFFSKRKLPALDVASVLGRSSPQELREGDFIDPSHFGPQADGCVLDARATARGLGVEADPLVIEFLEQLKQSR